MNITITASFANATLTYPGCLIPVRIVINSAFGNSLRRIDILCENPVLKIELLKFTGEKLKNLRSLNKRI